MNSFEIAEQVQEIVNKEIQYCRDNFQFNTDEFWCILQGTLGDCEDYVLLKRKMLLEKGWDHQKLNIVTCIANGEGHAVLFVETDKGGFIMDNCHQGIVDPKSLNYKWISIMRGGVWYQLLGF